MFGWFLSSYEKILANYLVNSIGNHADQKRSRQMKNGRTLQQLAVELERQLKTKKDFIADARDLAMVNGSSLTISGHGSYIVNDLAHEQIGLRTSIPRAYYEKMQKSAPELLDENVNHWLHSSDESRMVRTMDGNVRAFLSDRYRPLDNYDLAEHVLPVIQQLGCKIESCELTEKRMYLKCVNDRVQREITPGDVVQAGIIISNSEVGCGSVKIEPLVYRLVCKNGLIANDFAMKKYHVGRSGEELGEDRTSIFYKDRTRKADDRAFWMKVKDVVEGSLTEAVFYQIVNKMKKAKDVKIEKDPVKVIESIGKMHLLTEDERSNVLKFLIQGGDLTLYGMVNAITRSAQDVDSYDRSTELERVGGQVLEMVNVVNPV